MSKTWKKDTNGIQRREKYKRDKGSQCGLYTEEAEDDSLEYDSTLPIEVEDFEMVLYYHRNLPEGK